MKHKMRFSFGVFLLLLLSAGASFAVVVPGHDGTELALTQIPDIIRHVTGKTSGDLSMNKDSLFIYSVGGNQHKELYSFNNDGSTNHLVSLSSDVNKFPGKPYETDISDYSSISVVNTSAVSSFDAGKTLLNFALIDTKSGEWRKPQRTRRRPVRMMYNQGTYVVTSADAGAGGVDVQESGKRFVWPGDSDISGYLGGVKAGIKVKGYDGELVAFLTRDHVNDYARIHLYLGYVSYGTAAADARVTPVVSGSWLKTLALADVPVMFDEMIYFPISMAVGDFNNDGYANEIVVVETDRNAIHYNVLQISHTGSTPKDARFSVSEFQRGDVGSYIYNGGQKYRADHDEHMAYRERGNNMDGLTCTYSHCVVAGDFDGDGKTEFAIVYRDTLPNNKLLSVFRKVNAILYKHSLFVGYTGSIHVKTYKWDGSTFKTEEDVHDSNIYRQTNGPDVGKYWFDIDVALGVKAAVGDFDGDGRDDIAVLRIMLQYTEQYYWKSNFLFLESYSNFVFGAFVDWYTFNHGSIKPNYNRHTTNYGDHTNGWVGIRTTNMRMPSLQDEGIAKIYDESMVIESQEVLNKIRKRYYLQPLTGEQKPYPVIDREFDIIAGKFTGTVGKALTRDDLIIKYPQWADGSGNKLRSHVALMTNIPGVTNRTTKVQEITALQDREHLLALAKADYLGEGVSLGDVVKVTDDSDRDYVAMLQMFPYHVDNLTADGSALQKDPNNFTLRRATSVTYSNTFTSADTANLSYSMTKTAETIFALDCAAVRTASSTFKGIRGIVTSGIGDNDAIKKIGTIGKIWDALKDTVEETRTKSSKNSRSYKMTITTQANYQDTLYMNRSTRYLWRYPVLQVPAPAWLMGQTKDTTGSFDKSQVLNQRSYITFAMSEPSLLTSSAGVNDSHYHPYHERGNLFSYPAALEQIGGYRGAKSITDKGKREWNGSDFTETISLESTVTSQDQTKKVNKAGAITNFLSVIDLIFGSNLAKVPQNSDSSFTRSVTGGESIRINIPEAYSGARFSVLFDTYLDIAGTMTTGFAVKDFNRDDALWGINSLYSLMPDPSFLLPEKFDYSARSKGELDRAAFAVNENDFTAMKMRGTRFIISDYDIETDNILLKGVKYTISVPVYNASFVDADNFTVRLSYASTDIYSEEKTVIGEYTFTKLPGWGNGNSRQTATFTWTPESMDEGIYCLFAEIDPDNNLKEIHENRRNESGDLIDAGGNNMGYWWIGIAAADSPVFKRDEMANSEFHAADLDGFAFPYVHWVKADGLSLEDFIKQKVDGASELIPAAVELKYGGEYLLTNAELVGYKLKPEAKGKDISEITEDDIGLVFADLELAFFPNDDHKLHFRIDPEYLNDGIYFVLRVDGEDFPLTDIIYGSAVKGVGSSSSGGCYSGFGLIALLGVLGIATAVKKR